MAMQYPLTWMHRTTQPVCMAPVFGVDPSSAESMVTDRSVRVKGPARPTRNHPSSKRCPPKGFSAVLTARAWDAAPSLQGPLQFWALGTVWGRRFGWFFSAVWQKEAHASSLLKRTVCVLQFKSAGTVPENCCRKVTAGMMTHGWCCKDGAAVMLLQGRRCRVDAAGTVLQRQRENNFIQHMTASCRPPDDDDRGVNALTDACSWCCCVDVR